MKYTLDFMERSDNTQSEVGIKAATQKVIFQLEPQLPVLWVIKYQDTSYFLAQNHNHVDYVCITTHKLVQCAEYHTCRYVDSLP